MYDIDRSSMIYVGISKVGTGPGRGQPITTSIPPTTTAPTASADYHDNTPSRSPFATVATPVRPASTLPHHRVRMDQSADEAAPAPSHHPPHALRARRHHHHGRRG